MEESSLVISMRKVKLEHEQQTVIENVSFDMSEGEFIYLIGKTGAGKSTLLKSIYADVSLAEGNLWVTGYELETISRKEIPFLRRELGIVFQDFQLLTDRTVAENFSFVMKATGWKDAQEMEERTGELLEKVQLPGVENKYPHQLSGGEQQRVTIARALINRPQLILADEPTGNLDPVVSKEILSLFIEINQEGTAILMGTHQHNFIQHFPGRVIYCEEGSIRDISKKQVKKQFEQKKR